MDEQNKNLILATVLSFIVILVWFVVFPPPETQAPTETAAVEQSDTGTATVPPAVSSDSADVTVGEAATGADATAQTLAEAPRVPIATDALSGSISLLGGRIDDLSLNDYRTTIDEDAPIVTMLSPAGTPDAYYAMQGWAAGAGLPPEAVPGL
ncbi:MAG: membrane protein insertase YidC, partial [Rhodobacteraceae bacterium]|nr:membrane protein insertase YidC [Paracoccaceae bacterium]